MGEVFFYHMTRQPLEVTLPVLLGRARGAGWRVVIRAANPEMLDWLDDKLWVMDDGFLPHGKVGTGFDADQPILLSDQVDMPNDPQCLIAIGGAEVSQTEISTLTRAMILFDGNDEGAVAHARTQWKSLTEAGCAAKYWSQQSGKWEMKAEHTAPA